MVVGTASASGRGAEPRGALFVGRRPGLGLALHRTIAGSGHHDRASRTLGTATAPAYYAAREYEVSGMYQGKVLVVDDEVYILHILDFILGAESYDVVTATNGEQALQKVRDEKPDLVILDIMMPKLDGYETCRMIKNDNATKHIPVILLTAKGREIDQKLGREVGANDYITKPFSPNKLIERVQAILGVRR